MTHNMQHFRKLSFRTEPGHPHPPRISCLGDEEEALLTLLFISGAQRRLLSLIPHQNQNHEQNRYSLVGPRLLVHLLRFSSAWVELPRPPRGAASSWFRSERRMRFCLLFLLLLLPSDRPPPSAPPPPPDRAGNAETEQEVLVSGRKAPHDPHLLLLLTP